MHCLLLTFFLCGTSIGVIAQAATNSTYDYIGGIPLRVPGSCPVGSVTGQITTQQNCCAAGQTFVKIENSVCCANSTDCFNEILAAPKCADPSWQLCGTRLGGFCCQKGWICFDENITVDGVISPGGGVGCSAPGATLAQGQTPVTTVYAANSGPGTFVTTSSTFSASGTSSKFSSFTTLNSAKAGILNSISLLQNQTAESTLAQNTVPTTYLTSTYFSNFPSPTTSVSPFSTQKNETLGTAAISGIVVGGVLIITISLSCGVWINIRKAKSTSSLQKSKSAYSSAIALSRRSAEILSVWNAPINGGELEGQTSTTLIGGEMDTSIEMTVHGVQEPPAVFEMEAIEAQSPDESNTTHVPNPTFPRLWTNGFRDKTNEQLRERI